MDKLIQCLNNANNQNVKLFFITRRRNQRTKEITYQILASRIQPGVAQELKENGSKQLNVIFSHNTEIIPYGVLSHSDRTTVETIDYKCVPFLGDMLGEIAQPVDGNLLMDKDFSRVWGYIVRIENDNKTVFLFRKYTPKKLLDKGKFSCLIHSGQFEKLNDQIISLDSYYDAALLLEAQEMTDPEQTSEMFIFYRPSFESLFSFVDVYQHEVEARKNVLNEKGIIEDVSQLVETCCTDGRAIKKLARILLNGQLDSLNPENIRATIHDYDLPVTLDNEGKIKVSKDHLWVILRILNDDYVLSEATGSKYESRSKVRK
jgi:hypothetical protein